MPPVFFCSFAQMLPVRDVSKPAPEPSVFWQFPMHSTKIPLYGKGLALTLP
jgi:hypothetical protein